MMSVHVLCYVDRTDRMPQHPSAEMSGYRGGRQKYLGFHAAYEGRPSRQNQMREDSSVCRQVVQYSLN